ncbi:class I adenylate-forming enzyme family protein [Streptomyces cavernicola]|uniref:Class I adenylate-forming enzyme family protein n=1 Tax=Streptomyces cavernicola TaxID=3043613 RepID=A0ABT6SC08_9ACTN|nr:class I adenylate-forming enzyme family protein [Streptomyces sp. B-S-A6]MDI3405730.1 class I adenylate-forming enzyme family protein [Streptomyces sp. B-S-A6]
MTHPWTSAHGIVLRDLVPAALRRAWVAEGLCPDRDLYSLFSDHVRDHPTREAVVDPDGSLDYAELDAQVRHIAARLAEQGLGERDIIAVRVPNGRRAVAAELAVAAIGAVALPYPPGHGSRGPVSLLSRSRASAIVVERDTDAKAAVPDAQLPYLKAVFSWGEPTHPAGVDLRRPARRPFTPRPVDAEAPARILVTSGSESEPKMIAYSHNAMGGGRANYVRALSCGHPGPVRNLVLAPLASSYGSLGTSVTVAALGGTLIVQDGYDPHAALRALTAHRPTHVFGVPTMLRRLAELPPPPGEDLSALRAVVSSCDALPPATAEVVTRRFGRPVITIYGSSDGVNCHTAATGTTPEAGTGLPDPAVADIRITEDTGEICARGPMTPLAYVAAPELDARYRTPDGWVRTGDRGRLDEQGRLHVLGRLKQIVVRGGYNISPAEVEQALAGHPSIAEVACVAVPDEELGERLCACVRETPGAAALSLADLTGFLEGECGLERRKLPELLLRVGQMPLGPTGKICRPTLALRALPIGWGSVGHSEVRR